jgi:hypothetical protein
VANWQGPGSGGLYFPIKLRCTAAADLLSEASLEDALARALARAFTRARSSLPSSSAFGGGVVLHAPELAAGDPNREDRTALLPRVNRAVQMAARAAAVPLATTPPFGPRRVLAATASPATASSVSPGIDSPAAEPLSEPFDPTRFDPVLQMYEFPSYSPGTEKLHLASTPRLKPPADGGRERTASDHAPEFTTQLAWHSVASPAAFRKAFREVLEARANAGMLAPGYVGAIHRENSAYFIDVYFFTPSATDQPFKFLFSWKIEGITRFVRRREKIVGERAALNFTPNATYQIRWYAPGGHPDELVPSLITFYEPLLRGLLHGEMKRALPAATPAELDQRLRARIADFLKVYATSLVGVKCLLELRVNDQPFLVASGDDVRSDMDVALYPLTEVVHVKRKAEEQAKGDGGEPRLPKFPKSRGIGIELECVSLGNEPSVDDLSMGGQWLKRLIGQVASMLEMPVCQYAGCFAINAARVLRQRVRDVSGAASRDLGVTKLSSAEPGNLGVIDFTPAVSTGIQWLRRLASGIPKIGELNEAIGAVYDQNKDLIPDYQSWLFSYRSELEEQMIQAAGALFAATCQVLMLQLLDTSRDAILGRRFNFDAYAQHFEGFILPQLMRIDELMAMRDELEAATRPQSTLPIGGAPEGTASAPAPVDQSVVNWQDAARAVEEAFSPPPSVAPTPSGDSEQVIFRGDTPLLRDAFGNVWSKEGVEAAIQLRRSTAESVDPLVKQLVCIPEVMRRFAENGGRGLRRELSQLITDMLDANLNVTQRVESDDLQAFRMGHIDEDAPSGSSSLSGIHLLAQEQIGEFARGEAFYTRGLDDLLEREALYDQVRFKSEFGFLVFASVLCPPAGAVLGAVLAGVQLVEAEEKEETYRALIDPELVIRRSEVEAELFAARLGVALTFIPDIGPVLSGARSGVKALAQAGAAGVARSVERRVTQAVAEAIAKGLVEALVKACVEQMLVNELLELILGPIQARIQEEIEATGPAPQVGGATP